MDENEHGLFNNGGSGSFSRLLFSEEIDYFSSSSVFSPKNPPKMLCFGDDTQTNAEFCETILKQSGITYSDSTSTSSTGNTTKHNSLSKSTKCKVGNAEQRKRNGGSGCGAPMGGQRNCNNKRSKSESQTSKVKKEKLGERITALQQLVSPFGKTDTASVLHEAMGYIRFLHDQVQLLCSPYLQHSPHHLSTSDCGNNQWEEPRKDLRSRGLCLVPVESTAHVANNNGADFWSPATMNNNLSISKR